MSAHRWSTSTTEYPAPKPQRPRRRRAQGWSCSNLDNPLIVPAIPPAPARHPPKVQGPRKYSAARLPPAPRVTAPNVTVIRRGRGSKPVAPAFEAARNPLVQARSVRRCIPVAEREDRRFKPSGDEDHRADANGTSLCGVHGSAVAVTAPRLVANAASQTVVRFGRFRPSCVERPSRNYRAVRSNRSSFPRSATSGHSLATPSRQSALAPRLHRAGQLGALSDTAFAAVSRRGFSKRRCQKCSVGRAD